MNDKELIAELAAEFNIAKEDDAKLYAWRTKYRYLTQEDVAKISGLSIDKIARMYRKAGVPKKARAISSNRRASKVILNGDVTDTAWLNESISRYSKRHVQKSIKVNVHKYAPNAISGKNVNIPNPYFNATWVREHYIIKGWTKERCAKAAGVSRITFNRWLAKLNI